MNMPCINMLTLRVINLIIKKEEEKKPIQFLSEHIFSSHPTLMASI